jgi:hypothetical protein
MPERTKMIIEMEVTPAQGLALKSMFEYWNKLSNMGSSRQVAFFVDGDGNFHPKCQMRFSDPLPDLTDELKRLAVVEDKNGDRVYDYDPIAWKLRSGVKA